MKYHYVILFSKNNVDLHTRKQNVEWPPSELLYYNLKRKKEKKKTLILVTILTNFLCAPNIEWKISGCAAAFLGFKCSSFFKKTK